MKPETLEEFKTTIDELINKRCKELTDHDKSFLKLDIVNLIIEADLLGYQEAMCKARKILIKD